MTAAARRPDLIRTLTTLLAGLVCCLAAPAAAQTADAALSPVAQAAAQRGIRTCLSRIDALARDLAIRHSIGAYLFNRLDGADGNFVSISMELTPSPSGGPFYLSATFVPVAGAQCQVQVETVLHWSSDCVPVGLAYPGFQITGVLLGAVRVLAATGTERLFLMPAGTGCISIEKSVYF